MHLPGTPPLKPRSSHRLQAAFPTQPLLDRGADSHNLRPETLLQKQGHMMLADPSSVGRRIGVIMNTLLLQQCMREPR